MKGIKYSQKVLVVVKGGVVQSLYGSDSTIEVDVIDFDNGTFEYELDEEYELRKRSKGLLPIL